MLKRNTLILSLGYFAFLVLLFLSGMLTGVLSDAVYYLAFILPFFTAVALTRTDSPPRVGIGRNDALLFLPTVFPTVLLVFFISAVTSAVLFALTGSSGGTEIKDGVLFAMLYHAVLPALLEELLFRYLPMRLIAPYSRRLAVILSALFFALVHHSFFSIPYALCAGVIFITVDLMCESVLPSVILHFVNNAISVLWSLFSGIDGFALWFILGLALLSAVSLGFIAFRWEKYYSGLRRVFSGGREAVSPAVLIVALPALAVAVMELIS